MNRRVSRIFPKYVAFLVLLLASPGWVPERANAESAAAPRKIGVIIALTGPLAPVGISIRNALLMAQEEANPRTETTFIFEDDQFQAKNAVTAAEKLITVDHVDALITFSASTSAAVSNIAERRKMPLMAVTALANVGDGKQYVSSAYLSFQQQMELLATALDKRQAARVAIVTTEQDSMLQFRAAMSARLGSRVVLDESLAPGDTNLGSLATKIIRQKPDAVLLLVIPPHVSLTAKLLREQGYRGPFVSGPPAFNPPEIAAARGALDGTVIPGPNSKNDPEFFKRYRAKFGEDVISEAVYAHDAGTFLLEAVKSGDIAARIRSTEKFTGVAGEYTKGPKNDFAAPGELKAIQPNGTLAPAE